MNAHFSNAADIGINSWKGFEFLFSSFFAQQLKYRKHDVGKVSFEIDVMISLYPE